MKVNLTNYSLYWVLCNLHRRFVLTKYVVTVKSTLEISQNFVAFSEYMNFKQKLACLKVESGLRTVAQLAVLS